MTAVNLDLCDGADNSKCTLRRQTTAGSVGSTNEDTMTQESSTRAIDLCPDASHGLTSRVSVGSSGFFQAMNETKWLMFDDDFFIVTRRWFESWKSFVSYDYVLKKIVTEQRKVSELSIN